MAVSNPTRVIVVHTVYLRGVDVFRLMEVYMSMRRDGLQMTREILHLVLRGSSSTDERLALHENLSRGTRTESLSFLIQASTAVERFKDLSFSHKRRCKVTGGNVLYSPKKCTCDCTS